MEFIGRFSGFDADLKALEVQVCKSLLQAGRALQEDAKACMLRRMYIVSLSHMPMYAAEVMVDLPT